MEKEEDRVKKKKAEKIIKEALERFYKEIILLKSFVKINLQAMKFFIDQYSNILEDLEDNNQSFVY